MSKPREVIARAMADKDFDTQGRFSWLGMADAERYREWRRAFREGESSLWNALCEANSDADHDAAIDAVRGES